MIGGEVEEPSSREIQKVMTMLNMPFWGEGAHSKIGGFLVSVKVWRL